jgi:type 1 fimbriae regulatory protein FimB/type 1 fimbriae regulatory protein FimE
VREHLTEDEVNRLLAALKSNRHGQRDWLIGLLIYRHGLRVSEACDLRWDDINLAKRTIQVRRLKGRDDSAHYLERDEVAGLKRLQREQEPKSAYVFINERAPAGPARLARVHRRPCCRREVDQGPTRGHLQQPDPRVYVVYRV